MKFYDETKALYMEMEPSGVGLGAVLPQIRSSTRCPRDEPPNKSILRSISFASKNLSSAEKRYSNIEREALGILYRLKKILPLLLCKRGEYNTDHKPLVAIFKKRQSNNITETTMNSTQNTLIQSQNHIQAWNRSIHSRLALQIKPQGKQRCRNTWYAVK